MTDKTELYALIELLACRGWTPPQTGEALGYSAQHVRNILADLGLAPRRRSLAARLRALSPTEQKRVRNLTLQTRRPHQKRKSA